MMKKTEKGFTLIEILIAMAILIIGLVGVITTIPIAQKIVAKSDVQTRATIVAGKVMEELKSKGYDDLFNNNNWSGSESGFNWKAVTMPPSATDFNASVDLPSDGVLKIELSLYYKVGIKEKTIKLVTFYSR